MLKLTHNQSILTPLILLIALSFIYISFSTTSDTAFAARKLPTLQLVCHNGHVTSVSENAVCAHLEHGDCIEIGHDDDVQKGDSCDNQMPSRERENWKVHFGCRGVL